MSQLRSSIASAPRDSAAPGIFDANHVTSSSVKTRGTISGASSYYLNPAHIGCSRGVTLMLGCFYRRTSTTNCLVFLKRPPIRRPLPPCRLPDEPSSAASPTSPCCGTYGSRRPCPLPPYRLVPAQVGLLALILWYVAKTLFRQLE